MWICYPMQTVVRCPPDQLHEKWIDEGDGYALDVFPYYSEDVVLFLVKLSVN